MNSKKTTIIEVDDLCFSYGENLILDNVSFSICENDFIAVVGVNGSGKTTLVKIISGIIKPSAGRVRTKKDCKIAYLPQGSFFERSFPISIQDVILQGLVSKNSFFPFYTKTEKLMAEKIMKELNVYDYRNKKIGDLSGGQRQRVFISRALISNPSVLILDEPNTHIDSKSETELYKLLEEINKNTTIIMVSHDISAVSSLANRVACVNKKVVINDISEEISKKNGKILIQHSCNL